MKGGRGLSCNACEAGLGCGMRGGVAFVQYWPGCFLEVLVRLGWSGNMNGGRLLSCNAGQAGLVWW